MIRIFAALFVIANFHGAFATVSAQSHEEQRTRMIVQFSVPSSLDELAVEERQEIVRQTSQRVWERVIQLESQISENEPPAVDLPRLVREFDYTPAIVVELNATEASQLRQDLGVISVFPDRLDRPMLDRSIPSIGADRLHALGMRGQGTSIAILDTGIDVDHPMLAGRVVSSACFSTEDEGVSETLCPNDLNEDATSPDAGRNCSSPLSVSANGARGCAHGTHVASIAAGAEIPDPSNNEIMLIGVAADAGVIPVQVFSRFNGRDNCGSAQPCVLSYQSDQIAALEWLFENRDAFSLSVINMSLGSGRFESDCPADPRTHIIEMLRDAGVFVVVSAGNDGFSDAVSAPACVSEAVAVTTDASFANQSHLVDLSAPGVSITAAFPQSANNTETQTATSSGTSMAAPHVSGLLAVLRAAFPSASLDQIESTLAGVVSGDGAFHSRIPPTVRGDLAATNLDTTSGGRIGDLRVNTLQPITFEQRLFSNSSLEVPISIENIGSDTIEWRVRSSVSWLAFQQQTGDRASPPTNILDAPSIEAVLEPGQTIQLDPTILDRGLSPGVYRGAIWVGQSGSGSEIPISVVGRFTDPEPVNDDFDHPITFQGRAGILSFRNSLATFEPGEPEHGTQGAGRSLWWIYQPDVTGTFSIAASGERGAVVAVYSGNAIDGLTLIGSSVENEASTFGEPVEFQATEETPYRIAIMNPQSSSGGSGEFRYRFIPTSPPANDEISNAIELEGETGIVRVSPWGATRSEVEEDFFNSAHSPVWYRWTAPQTESYVFYTVNMDAPVYAFTSMTPTQETMVIDYGVLDEPYFGGTIHAEAGTTYYIATYYSTGSSEEFETDLAWRRQSLPITSLRAAVLPSTRSIYLGEQATAFATIINPGSNSDARNCRLLPPANFQGTFSFWQTDPATNVAVGEENEPVDIASGGAQSFAFAASLPEVGNAVVGPMFRCDQYWYDGRSSSVSSLALSVEDEPVSDIISIALTATGDGVVRRSPNGVGAFSVAAINIGSLSQVRVSPSITTSNDIVALEVCETNPANGQCLTSRSEYVLSDFLNGDVRTYTVFVRFNEADIRLAPAHNRVQLEFLDGRNLSAVRGATSVAVTSQ
ncbi:S8 family peptidase [Hyphobacterium sp.]|uniref:S8 family peptidase n=1 Tax=Hyphobacterium sp. TaxID=2004662 RepID=UPI003747A2C9